MQGIVERASSLEDKALLSVKEMLPILASDKTDTSRKDSKRILIDMFNKAIDADLLSKNIAKQINTVVTKDGRPEEPRVLTHIRSQASPYKLSQHQPYVSKLSAADIVRPCTAHA